MRALLKRYFPKLYLVYLNWELGGWRGGLRAISAYYFQKEAVQDRASSPAAVPSKATSRIRNMWASITKFFRSKQIAILAVITTALVLTGLVLPEVSATSNIAISRLFEMLMKWNFVLVPAFAGYALYYAFCGHEIKGNDIQPLSEEWERKHRLMSHYIIGTMIVWALQLRL